jgi:hypothetical protein
MEQPDGQRVLEGLEQLRLIFGYLWDQDADDIGQAVLSMRHGVKNVLWVHEVPSSRVLAAPLPSRAGPGSSVVRSRLADMVEEVQRSRQS